MLSEHFPGIWERESTGIVISICALPTRKGAVVFYGGITMKKILALIFAVVLVLSLASCGSKTAEKSPWDSAVYTENTEVGEGGKTVKVSVVADDKQITFTIHTDRDILGDALLDNNLVEGDAGEFGLYIKKVNGITADYDVDGAYWAFMKDGEMMMTGVDGQSIQDGESYELVYTKQ